MTKRGARRGNNEITRKTRTTNSAARTHTEQDDEDDDNHNNKQDKYNNCDGKSFNTCHLASTRLVLALAGAVVARQAVDVALLVLELLLEVAAIGAWRSYYTSTSRDMR